MRPLVTERVPLHSKSLCKNIARASLYAPTKLGGGHKQKRFVLPLQFKSNQEMTLSETPAKQRLTGPFFENPIETRTN